MIQRLVAGHIHNSQGHSTYEVSAVSANSSSSFTGLPTSTSTTTTTTTTTASTIAATATTATTTTTSRPGRRKSSSSYRLARPSPRTTPPPPSRNDDGDDEALLSEPDDFDNWDNGILRLSAGSGKETQAESGAKHGGKEGNESKKTLADQVRDGKYGLIEKELFRRVPKRPGVLSYARNPEVPLDNERNFGGLNEQDIWLAEDHLLVIKGGGLNEPETGDESWPAIDDYDAPPRQIKLPAHPVVPPPFPVQLEPHGPLQLIRDNQIESLHPSPGNVSHTAPYTTQLHSAPGHGPSAHSAARPGTSATPKSTDPEPSYVYPAPYAPWLLYPNETLAKQSPSHPHTLAHPHSHTPPANPLLRGGSLLGPWLINGLNGGTSSPGGALPANISDFDEDDPSLYYPPAYSFVYRSNYSNPVPPGPLVPGIVLPPPPDHFSRLEVISSSSAPPTATTTTTTSTTTTRRPPSSSSTTTTTSSPPSSRTTTPPTSRLSLKYNSVGYLPPRQTPPKYVERVPVPVAVPIPIYPINYQPTTPRPPPPPPQQQLVFVPSTERSRERVRGRERERERERDRERDHEQAPLSKSNPIYYEYFEAKQRVGQPQSSLKLKSNVIDDFLGTGKRPHYKTPPSPANDVAAVVSITPKPVVTQLHAEYDAAVGQLIRSNLIAPPSQQPREVAAAGGVGVSRFHAPDFDRQPFLPMVNYSADEHDADAFKAIVYQPQSQPQPQSAQRQRQLRVGKYQQLQLQLEPTVQPGQDADAGSYLPEALLLQRQRQLRVGKQQLQLQQQQQQQSSYGEPLPQSVYSTPSYLDNQLQPRPAKYQLRPPSAGPVPLQFWQRPSASGAAQPPQQQQQAPPPQFKRLRHGGGGAGIKHPYPPYFVPSYASGPGPEPLYRLLPVPQHKHWRQPSGNKQLQPPPPQQQQQQQQYYPPERGGVGVGIGHSLASDILVNYNTNNQFNPQAELVPQAQLGPPPPLSYQAQSGGQASLWSDRPVRQSRAQEQV